MALKAIRIGEDLETLLKENQELKIYFVDKKVKLIMLPESAQISFMLIVHGNLVALDYWYNNKHVRYYT